MNELCKAWIGGVDKGGNLSVSVVVEAPAGVNRGQRLTLAGYLDGFVVVHCQLNLQAVAPIRAYAFSYQADFAGPATFWQGPVILIGAGGIRIVFGCPKPELELTIKAVSTSSPQRFMLGWHHLNGGVPAGQQLFGWNAACLGEANDDVILSSLSGSE